MISADHILRVGCRLLSAIALFWIISSTALAVEQNAVPPANTTDPQQLFHAAGQAYDTGNINGAISLYNRLITDGYATKEVFFNLGNAYYRAENPGFAILNYKNALNLDPRNAEVKANLRFVQESTLAINPSQNILQHYLQLLLLPEWVAIAVLAYWCLAALLGLYMLHHTWRWIYRRALVGVGILLVIACVGTFEGIWQRIYPEVVIISPNQKALFAPIDGSTAHFSLPVGSVVRQEEVSGNWIRVSTGKESGWVKQDDCKTVAS